MLLQRCQKAAQTLNAWGQGTRVQDRVRRPQAARAGSSHAKGKSEHYPVQKSEKLGYFPLNILRADFLHCFLWDSKHSRLLAFKGATGVLGDSFSSALPGHPPPPACFSARCWDSCSSL